MKWYERANEASFRATPGGHVFQAPSPWMFVRPRYYLVNEIQKAQLLAGLGRWRAHMLAAHLANGALICAIVVLMTLWPASFVRPILPLYVQLGAGPFMALLIALLAVVMAPAFAVPQIYLARALRPVLVEAPLTEERIKMSEQLPAIAMSASGKVLAVGLFCGLATMSGGLLEMFDAYLEGRLATRALPAAMILAVSVLFTGHFAYLLRLKKRKHVSAD